MLLVLIIVLVNDLVHVYVVVYFVVHVYILFSVLVLVLDSPLPQAHRAAGGAGGRGQVCHTSPDTVTSRCR